MKLKHLIYCTRTAFENGIEDNPWQVMKSLGIIYQHATPQTIADQVWYWNCHELPDELPIFLKEKDIDPIKMVGYGLSQEEAEKIRDFNKKNGTMIT